MSQDFGEIVFGGTGQKAYRATKKGLKEGKLRKIHPGIFSSNLKDDPSKIVSKNIWAILAYLYPGAIVSHRSALEIKATKDNVIFLTYKYTKKIKLPGITLSLIEGPKPTDEDKAFLGGLFISSTPRAYLENMQAGRSRGKASKSLSRMEVEEKLDELCRIQGEDELNRLRDNARRVSQKLKMKKEFEALNGIISSILRSRPAKELKSPGAKARAQGKPYDPERLELFTQLMADIQSEHLPLRKTQEKREKDTEILSFFEAYFSNYIEGTIFEIDEAKEIVFENAIPAKRPKDAHDIMGTYALASDPKTMKITPDTSESLLKLLKARHITMMEKRDEVSPGLFKEKNNRAGQTVFVKPDLVPGTLEKGFEVYRTIDHPLGRAIFMMFLIAEVHPFTDGNGRMARIMMNAELVKHGLSRIIIPIVYRDDYMGALRAISRTHNTKPLIKMLDRAQEYTATIRLTSFDAASAFLHKTNAFLEPDQGKLIIGA